MAKISCVPKCALAFVGKIANAYTIPLKKDPERRNEGIYST